MSVYNRDAGVQIFPFSQRVEGEETIIANATQTSFLSLPSSAVDILTWLAEGKTVAEAQDSYQQKYNECPDIDDFLELLESEGFLSSRQVTNEHAQAPVSQQAVSTPSGRTIRYHFDSFPEGLARFLFSKQMVIGAVSLIFVGLVLLALDPAIFPSTTTLVYKEHAGPLLLGLVLFGFFTLFLHEMAHLIAAKAAGVSARLGIGRRLWILVAETDLSGVWLAAPAQRYLAFLAGPLLDAASGAICLALLFAQRHDWLVLSPFVLIIVRSAFLNYLFRLIWQCYFFLRTDFYYVLVTLLKCKNLMQDTRDFIFNLLARCLPMFRHHDLSALSRQEMNVIRFYAVLWIVGRAFALYTLIFLTLPILIGYVRLLPPLFSPDSPLMHLPLLDSLAWIALVLVTFGPQVIGLLLWARSFLPRWR